MRRENPQTRLPTPVLTRYSISQDGSPVGIKREHGQADFRPQAVAVPATVSGEPTFHSGHWATGKAERPATTRQPGDLPSQASPGRRTGLFGGTVCSVLAMRETERSPAVNERPFAIRAFSAFRLQPVIATGARAFSSRS